jgi:hypothetical protein
MPLPIAPISMSDVNSNSGAPSNAQKSFNSSVFRHYADSSKWGSGAPISMSDIRGRDYTYTGTQEFRSAGGGSFTVPSDVYRLYVTWPVPQGFNSTTLAVSPGQVLGTNTGGMGGASQIGSLGIPAYAFTMFSQSFYVDWHIYMYININGGGCVVYDNRGSNAGGVSWYTPINPSSLINGYTVTAGWSARSRVYMNQPDGAWNIYYGITDDPGGGASYSVTSYIYQNGYFKVQW